MSGGNSYLQEVDQVFDVHVNAHPLVIESGYIDEHVVTHDFPGVGEYRNRHWMARAPTQTRESKLL